MWYVRRRLSSTIAILADSDSLSSQANSSLPLRPSSLAQPPSGQENTPAGPDSSYSSHTRTWSASLSAASPPFVPQTLAPGPPRSLEPKNAQQPDGTERYSNRETGPIDSNPQDPIIQDRSVEGLPVHQGQGQTRSLIDGQGRHVAGMGFIGSLPKQGQGHTGLQAFSRDFGILPGSEEEKKAVDSGRVRNWTLSQLGKGKPSG